MLVDRHYRSNVARNGNAFSPSRCAAPRSGCGTVPGGGPANRVDPQESTGTPRLLPCLTRRVPAPHPVVSGADVAQRGLARVRVRARGLVRSPGRLPYPPLESGEFAVPAVSVGGAR